jgi:hypothetical protein
MARRDPCLRFRITPTMMTRIEREAQARDLKTHELARVALAEGLRVLFHPSNGDTALDRQAA